MVNGSELIFSELREAALLVSDLPEAKCFDRAVHFPVGANSDELNFEQKLGHLYEDALEALLRSSDSIDCLARGLQVSDPQGRTIGEMDFVLYDRIRRKHIHLELAVKFYLAVNVAEVWTFPGPDARDSWKRKLERMRTHQFVLSQREEGRALLRERFGIDEVEVEQLVYGSLFLPSGASEQLTLEAMNPKARIGRWLYRSEWNLYFDEKDVDLIPKPFWPVGVNHQTRALFVSVSSEEIRALARARCTMFVPKGRTEPVFLVPDGWPNDSSSCSPP